MRDKTIVVCIEGGVVQAVLTNAKEEPINIVVVDRDCTSPGLDDPEYVDDFYGSPAYIYRQQLDVDEEYCNDALFMAVL
jgi:hypothetical protein